MSETGRLISVSKTTLGSVLAADASSGDGAVTVQDTTDFGEQSGTLQLGGSQYPYTTTDPGSGVVTLVGTLAANAAEGDRVDVWDTGLGQVAESGRALVALPGRLANDEPIDADIAHSLLPLLATGLRDPGTEEAVTMEQRGDSWVVVDVRGKRYAPASGGAVLASGDYSNLAYDGTSGFFGFDASTVNDDHGGIAAHVGTDIFGNITLLTVGWYQTSCISTASGGTAGHDYDLQIALGVAGFSPPNGYDRVTKQSGVGLRLYAATVPFYNDSVGNTVTVYLLDANTGGSIGGTGPLAVINVVKLAD